MLRTLAYTLALLTAFAGTAWADTIAVIGTGNVGGTLGPRWASLGHTVVYGSRTPDADKVKALVKQTPHGTAASPQAAAQKADVILIAVPGTAARAVISELGPLKGKVIIDATNVLLVKDGKIVDPDMKDSVLAQIQDAAPDAFAVKAFNTVTTALMKDPSLSGGRVTLPIAGADAGAKAKVAALAKVLGFGVVDLGGLEMARFAEQLGRLYVAYSATHKPERLEFDFHTWKP